MIRLALAIALLASTNDEGRRAEARDLARQGDAFFAQGRCDKALPLWRHAEETFHAPTILLRVARCEALLGKVVDASDTLERLVGEKLAPDVPPSWREAQAQAKEELPAVRARVASLAVEVSGANAHVEIDGAEAGPSPQRLDPGRHHVRARAGDAAWEDDVVLGEGDAQTLRLSAVREPPRVGKSPWRSVGFALGGAGIAAIAVGAVFFGAPALGGSNKLDDVCGADRQRCPLDRQPEIDRLKTRALVADVWMATGAALVLGGGVLVLTSPAPKTEGPRFRIQPMGAGAAVTGTF